MVRSKGLRTIKAKLADTGIYSLALTSFQRLTSGNSDDVEFIRALLLINESIQCRQSDRIFIETNAVRAHTIFRLSQMSDFCHKEEESGNSNTAGRIRTLASCMLFLQTLLIGTDLSFIPVELPSLLSCSRSCFRALINRDLNPSGRCCSQPPSMAEAMRKLSNNTFLPDHEDWLYDATNIYLIVVWTLYSDHLKKQIQLILPTDQDMRTINASSNE